MLQSTGYLQSKVADIFHVHQPLCVDVVMANRSHRVSERESSGLGVMGCQLQVSSTTGTATAGMASG